MTNAHANPHRRQALAVLGLATTALASEKGNSELPSGHESRMIILPDFASIASALIGDDVSLIQTNGYDRPGFGGARYVVGRKGDFDISPTRWSTHTRDGRPVVIAEPRLDLAMFGFRGNARYENGLWVGSDDGDAWRAAIAAAAVTHAGIVIIPFGETGVSLVSHPIVEGDLPPGLIFEGSGANAGNEYLAGLALVYTGTGCCWDIRPSIGRSPRLGRWTWRQFSFHVIDPGATAFSFGDPVAYCGPGDRAAKAGANGRVVLDDESHLPLAKRRPFLAQIRFESVTLVGPEGGKAQRGDGIRGAKVFELVIDSGCEVKGFRRNIWLLGCDNCRVEASRIAFGGCNLRVERSGFFGNGLFVTTRYFGPTHDTGDDRYSIYDEASVSSYVAIGVEEIGGPVPLIYLNGEATSLYKPALAGGPLFRLGPAAREISLLSPMVNSTALDERPIIDSPQLGHPWDFGYVQADARMSILDASANFAKICGRHPRLRYQVSRPGEAGMLDVTQADRILGPEGLSLRSWSMDALSYYGRSFGTPAQGGVELIDDPAEGWLIQLDNRRHDPETGAPQGFFVSFDVGGEYQPGIALMISVAARSIAAGDYALVALIDGKEFARTALPTRADFALSRLNLVVPGHRGSRLQIGIIGYKALAALHIRAIQIDHDPGRSAAVPSTH